MNIVDLSSGYFYIEPMFADFCWSIKMYNIKKYIKKHQQIY